MSIPVSDNLPQWLSNKGLQGYLKEPHPQAIEVIQQIDISKITNKQVRRLMNLKREGFDAA